jgi:predicted dehydrogenase
MGWYHAMQILDQRVIGARLQHVVEPWYMSAAAASNDDTQVFQEWRREMESRGVVFHESVTTIPPCHEIRLTIFSARTADNPALMHAYLQQQASHNTQQQQQIIFLEKPGAPSVAQLQDMQQEAARLGIPIYMGFNKNVSSYVQKARTMSPPCHLTFVHNNSYTPDGLPECFERNAEGMLSNMAIHELALCITYFGVTVNSIAQVRVDKAQSSCETLVGPASGKAFTDFRSLKFAIETQDGQKVSIAADRCGGDDSVAIVSNAKGEEVAHFTMPDEATVSNIPHLQQQYGKDTMPYFFAQDPDYLRLKQLLVNYLLDGGNSSLEGVATIDVAIESLKVADYLTPILQEQLQ